MTRPLVYLDCETTGLDYRHDDVVELSYALEQGDPKTLYFGMIEVPEFIDNLIGFTARGISGIYSSEEEFDEFLDVFQDSTMVSANPKFDASFLETEGLYVAHHRTLDIESYAMHALGLNFVPGMSDIYNFLTEAGYQLTTPDHTSRNDVLALRQAHQIIKHQYPSGYINGKKYDPALPKD